jgi:hypothetical protein
MRACVPFSCLLFVLSLAVSADPAAGHYVSHDDGTASTTDDRLMWKRCSEGQRWEAQRCTGVALPHTWDEALAMAEVSRFGGHSDWRLPRLEELQALHANADPLQFEWAAEAAYWTATAIAHGRDGAFIVLPGSDAGAAVGLLQDGHMVRLVRDLR